MTSKADEHRKAQEYANKQLNALYMRFLSTLGFLMQSEKP